MFIAPVARLATVVSPPDQASCVAERNQHRTYIAPKTFDDRYRHTLARHMTPFWKRTRYLARVLTSLLNVDNERDLNLLRGQNSFVIAQIGQ